MNQHGNVGMLTEHLQGPCGFQCGLNCSRSGPHAFVSPGGSVFSEVERRAHICPLSSYYHLLPLSHVFFTPSRIPPEQSSRKTKALGFKLKGLNSFMTLVSGVHDGPGTCDPVCLCQWKTKCFLSTSFSK